MPVVLDPDAAVSKVFQEGGRPLAGPRAGRR